MRLLLVVATIASVAAQGADRIPSLTAIQAAGAKLRPLMRDLPPPDPDPDDQPTKEQPEPPQNFREYLATNPNRPNRMHPTFYLQAIGDIDRSEERVIDEVEIFFNIAYGTAIKRAAPISAESVPQSVRFVRNGWGPSGFLVKSLLENVIAPHRPKDAVSVLAFTTEDLWKGEGLKVCHGRASFERCVAAMSFARISDPDECLELERALKVASHEVAHTLGLFHCLTFQCGMNATHNREDLDHRPLPFCSECEMKIFWACGLDPVSRTQALLDYCEPRRLTDAANDYRRRLQALRMSR